MIKLKDYEPKIYDEIFGYWQRILDILSNRIVKKTDRQGAYIGVIINSIRSITLYHGFDLLVDYLNIIFNVKDWYCEEGLRKLIHYTNKGNNRAFYSKSSSMF